MAEDDTTPDKSSGNEPDVQLGAHDYSREELVATFRELQEDLREAEGIPRDRKDTLNTFCKGSADHIEDYGFVPLTHMLHTCVVVAETLSVVNEATLVVRGEAPAYRSLKFGIPTGRYRITVDELTEAIDILEAFLFLTAECPYFKQHRLAEEQIPHYPPPDMSEVNSPDGNEVNLSDSPE